MKSIAKVLSAVTTTLFASSALAEPLAVGAPLPAVEQKNQNDQIVKLAEAGAKGYTLVYFYPKSDTPGCTKQACSLRDSYTALTEKGVKIFGVSMDKVASQKAFQEKYKLPFELLADADGKVVCAHAATAAMTLPFVAAQYTQALGISRSSHALCRHQQGPGHVPAR